VIRPLEQQFPPLKAAKIRRLIERLGAIEYPPGAARFYAAEVQVVLEAGALLAALSTSWTLLEVTARARLVQQGPRLERKLEEDKSMKLPQLVDELAERGVLSATDREWAKNTYDKVRIPVQHGISARFIRSHESKRRSDVREWLYRGMPVSGRDLEELIEEKAVGYLAKIVALLERVTGR
jgi:hypothetical protein